MTAQPIVPNSPASHLARTLKGLRLEAGLLPKEMSVALRVPLSLLIGYEQGTRKPTQRMLERLSAVLKCEDLRVQFPSVTPISLAQLALPDNVGLRLKHLVNEVAEGNQRWFCHVSGLPEGSLSHLINGGLSFTLANVARLLALFPMLSEKWLRTGHGRPFPDGDTPRFGPVAYPEKNSTKPAPPYVVIGNRTVRVQQWFGHQKPEPFPSLPPVGRGMSAAVEQLDELIKRLEKVVDNACGLDKRQTLSVLTTLRAIR